MQVLPRVQHALYRVRCHAAHRSRHMQRTIAAATSRPPVIIAIDGPAASGKGTLARQLAQQLRLAYLDTGLLYRATAHKALQLGINLNDAEALARLALQLTSDDVNPSDTMLNQLRSETTGAAASKVSVLPAVRQAVNSFPRAYVQRLPAELQGCVLDGRDVGTVLFPEAPVKLFLVASAEVRARRRLLELRGRGDNTTSFDSVLQAVLERDARDSSRDAAPLKPAPDAVLLDTSSLTAEEVLQQSLQTIKQQCPHLLQVSSSTYAG